MGHRNVREHQRAEKQAADKVMRNLIIDDRGGDFGITQAELQAQVPEIVTLQLAHKKWPQKIYDAYKPTAKVEPKEKEAEDPTEDKP
jgi:hypothetical protein